MIKQSPPSIFRLDILEIILGTMIVVLMILSFRNSLWTTAPFGYQSSSVATYPIWFAEARAELFRDFSWFFVLSGFLASVSLIRFVRRQYHSVPLWGQISPKGYLLLTWPLLFLIPAFHTIISFFNVFCWLVLLLTSIIIYWIYDKQRNYQGNLIPVLLNISAFLPIIIYSARLWELFGD